MRTTKDIRKPDTKGIDHRQLPTGTVLSNPLRGEFQGLPLFGWIAKRDKDDVPVVMLILLLMRGTDEPIPRGTLQVELPVLPETELPTLALLERYGWDGRVWPRDEGWPTGSEADEGNILSLMEQAGLSATLTFPPGEHGVATQLVNVERSKGPFLMPPLPAYEGEPDSTKLDSFRQLCGAPTEFFGATA